MNTESDPRFNRSRRPSCSRAPAAEAASFHRVKAAVLETIEQIRAQCREAAEYLVGHLVFDEARGTVCYTGDDRLKMSLQPGPPPPASPYS
jgi:hypothetical protein